MTSVNSTERTRPSGRSGVWVASVIVILGILMGWGTWSRYAREHPATSEAKIISETQAEVALVLEQEDLVKPGMRGFVSRPDSVERIMGRVDSVRREGDKTIVTLVFVKAIPSDLLGQEVEAVIDTLRPFDPSEDE